MSAYDFKVKDIRGKEVSLEKYKGKVSLVLNGACEALLAYVYRDLENLYQKYKEDGFTILDFPCNQFGEKAAGSDEEVNLYSKVHFKITFPQFAKVNLLEEPIEPLFQYLIDQAPFKGIEPRANNLLIRSYIKAMDKEYPEPNRIRWNFTKFLVDREGKVVARYEFSDPLEKIEEDLKKLLDKESN